MLLFDVVFWVEKTEYTRKTSGGNVFVVDMQIFERDRRKKRYILNVFLRRLPPLPPLPQLVVMQIR